MVIRILKNISFLLFLIFTFCKSDISGNAESQPPEHDKWDYLLKKYVTQEGWVDYQGLFNEKNHLEKYLTILSENPPNDKWTGNERLAYWINAYNAFTIQLVLKHYPVESIKDIGPAIQIPFVSSVFDKQFIEINGESIDLNYIEHAVLRKEFDEPGIHFAINCASVSCPKLRNEAYTSDNIIQQLQVQAVDFVNDSSKNQLSANHIRISKIFQWFTGDFTRNGTIIDFLNKYADVQIEENAEIDYKEYNWELNDLQEINTIK